MGDGMASDGLGRFRGVEHRRADHRHALRQAAHQRRKAECAAKRRAGQHAAVVVVAEGLRDRRAVAQ
ncbi:hypothetical protein G6F62_015952 [Rhizopus arrhizus]|nr:hypothetical protein G6F62_015952 [Rhizopus arrhizus]KAG1601604.1 hypothetical protein G6F45_014301 [Rhizopus arrhizus]